MLERFEVDQEVAAFVSERRGAPPDDSDVDNLDAAYLRHIRPTLDALDVSLRRRWGRDSFTGM